MKLWPAVWRLRIGRSAIVFFCLALLASPVLVPAGPLVFHEIMYHPATNEAALEWVELHNQHAVDLDVSGWRIAGGIDFTFPVGTVVPGRGYVVVAANPGALAAAGQFGAALGPFTGRLSNNGETLTVRNNSGRIMDEFTYGVEGDWPVGADGGGVTLAKAHPHLPSDAAASWRMSAQMGGTPGAANFPAGGTIAGTSTLVTWSNVWRFHDGGVDLGTAWRTPGFDDVSWSSGPALLFLEDAVLTVPKVTPLTPGRRTYYFRTTFNFSGDTNYVSMSLRPLVDDGAVVYLNGVEVHRVNLPAGTIQYTNAASGEVDNAVPGSALALPSGLLVPGGNTLAVEVHQFIPPVPVIPPPPPGLTLLEIGGVAFATNLSRNAGSTAFGRDEIGGGTFAIHKIPNVRDGIYGNGNSWIGDSPNSFIGISFGAIAQSVGRVAWGRDNTGSFSDRTAGTYTLEYTTVPNPGAATPNGSWTLIGSVTYAANGQPNSLRHAYSFPPVNATGFRLTVPGSSFADGACIDELELAAFAPPPPELRRVSTGGGMAPGNFATNAGATPLARDQLNFQVSPGVFLHRTIDLNDGVYGNNDSWIGNSANSFCGVAFGGARLIGRVAWGRDNTGAFSDRTAGSYTLQYTTNATPSAATPDAQWFTLGTVTLDAAPSNALRHLHEFSPVTATAIRLFTPGNGVNTGACVDEIEVYAPDTEDIVWGAELAATFFQPPAPRLVLNEVAGATNDAFFIEIASLESTPVSLAGFVLKRDGTNDGEYVFPAGNLAPAALLSVSAAELGFAALAGDKLLLFTPARDAVLDAVVVKDRLRGRTPDGAGRWQYPDAPTPGASNAFTLHTGVVLNEIMYHPRELEAVPADLTTNLLIAAEATWRFHDGGIDLGTAWRAPGYNDSGWASGPASLAFEDAVLTPLRGATLAGGRTTCYFRTRFNWSGSTSNTALALRSLVDDGAVFYLNGTEVLRLNMPAGAVQYSTLASQAVGNASLATAPVLLALSNLVAGENVLAVEVHQAGNDAVPPLNTNVVTSAGFSVTPAANVTLTWNGNNGEFADPGPSPVVADNAALALRGTVPFGSSEFDGGGIHRIVNINDGVYGNSRSWIANFSVGDPAPYVGLRFTGVVAVASLAWGRDNGYDAECCGGVPAADRWQGTYTIQFTTVGAPGPGTAETGLAATGWETLATVTYLSQQGNFTPWLRHRSDLRRSGAPVNATGLRLKVSSSQMCVDEIEVNPPAVDVGNADLAFAAELSAFTTNAPALPFRDATSSWVELHNRAGTPADLTGWRLDEGIDFHFPPGTILPPGGFLVVAKDLALMQSLWPGVNFVGPYTNRLSHRDDYVVLKDAANNIADEVHYFDGGRWPELADGGGSSLELRDARGDNAMAESWAASDEGGRTGWSNVVYRGVAQAEAAPSPTQWNEFVIGLLDAGEVWLDDIHVRDVTGGGSVELIQNSTFSGGLGTWRVLGNHHGDVVSDGGNNVLRLRANGPTDDTFNHVETTLVGNTAIVNGREYEISFRAKHVGGDRQLLTRLYFNRLPRVTRLPVSPLAGTPGAANSRAVANAGPTFANLRHAPVVPAAAQPVTVSVAASDPDGVASATLRFSVNGGGWSTAAMSLQNGTWSGVIPGQAAASIVQFYAEAVDGLGASATFPAGGTNSRALYKVQDGAAGSGPAHTFRLVMTPADRDFQQALTNIMSNDRLGATVIYDETEVYYGVRARLKGSLSGRPLQARMGFDVAFAPDQLFRGHAASVDIDRSGGWRFGVQYGQDEILVKHIINRAGGVSTTSDDIIRLLPPRDDLIGSALLSPGRFDNDHLASEFQDGGDGPLFEFDAIYIMLTTTDGNPQSPKLPHPYGHPPGVNTDIRDLGPDPENYRWHFRVKNHRERDDYAALLPFVRSFSLTGSALDAATQALMDEDEWMRCFAAMSLCGVGDAYTWGNNHNLLLYARPKDGKIVAMPFDWDFAFLQSVDAPLYGDQNLRKVIELPANLRRYYCHLQDIIDVAANSAYLARWADHYDDFCTAQNFSSIPTYVQQRADYVRGQLPAAVPFSITTSNGMDFTTDTNVLRLSGTATFSVRDILVNGVAYAVTWTTVSNWTLSLPLTMRTNTLLLQGVGRDGAVLSNAVDSITVVNTGIAAPRPVVINEWMADNAAPGGFPDPLDGLNQDWFELFNPNDQAVDLSGYHVTDTLAVPAKFTLPSGTLIGPRGFLLIWADEEGLQNGLGTNGDMHASFKLTAGGETIALFSPDGITLQSLVVFTQQVQNVSQGLYPDGATNTLHSMPFFTPRGPNTLAGPLRLVGIQWDAGLVTLTWASDPGRSYRIEFKDSLDAPGWQPAAGPVSAVAVETSVSLAAGPAGRRFYRVVLDP